uniref:Odorant receptor n=1 Tax=Yemma signatus TaxID=300820 RepID=A0A385H4Z7_9HEMI|nr:odorant receptor [Yemma signatus]
MGWFKNISDWLGEYCESDEATDSLFKRDYYYTNYISGIYASYHKGYKYLSMVIYFIHTSVSLFHMYVLLRTCLIVQKYNFTLMAFLLQLFMINQFCLFALLAIALRRQVFRTLTREMIGEFFTYQDEENGQLLQDLREEDWREKKRLMVLPVFLCFIGANCILLAPVIDNNYGDPGFNREESGLFTLAPIPVAYPWENADYNYFYNLFVCTGLQIFTAIFICSLIGSCTLALMNLVFAYNLHVKFLIRNIDDIEVRTEKLFFKTYNEKCTNIKDGCYEDPRFQKCLDNCLKKNFIHHQKITKWFDSLQTFISPPVGSAYSTGTLVIALSLLSIKTGTSLPGTALTSAMMCILEVAIMGLLSILGQRITDLNATLRESIYNIKWYGFSPIIKLNLLIIKEMLQKPVELKGFGLITCNLDTFSNVMNSAYSYYNLIMAF